MDISKLSEAKLEALLEKRMAVTSQINNALISAGRGNELHSKIILGTDPLSTQYREAFKSEQEVWNEIKYREFYHGSHKPVKKR